MQYEVPTQPPRQRLLRSTREKMISGVSGGLAEYFDLDPVVVRLIWIAAGIVTGGLAIPVYGVLWMIMPRQDDAPGAAGWKSTAASADSHPGFGPAPAPSGATPDPSGATTDPLGAASDPPTATADPLGANGDPFHAAPATEPGVTTAYASEPSSYGPSPSGYGPGPSGYGPAAPTYTSAPQAYTPSGSVPEYRRRRQKTAGVILIALGVMFMASQLGIFSWHAWRYFWPVVLIAIGAGLLLRQNAWRR